jgi:hypothetical protein
MSLSQTRPKDLITHLQLDPSDPEYIPANELYFVVDHPSFTRPKKYSQENFTGAIQNIQKGRITGLQAFNVSQSFSTPFNSAPVGFINVYRSKVISGTKTIREDVLFYDLTETPTGFSLVIDSEESLTGVIVEYLYQ